MYLVARCMDQALTVYRIAINLVRSRTIFFWSIGCLAFTVSLLPAPMLPHRDPPCNVHFFARTIRYGVPYSRLSSYDTPNWRAKALSTEEGVHSQLRSEYTSSLHDLKCDYVFSYVCVTVCSVESYTVGVVHSTSFSTLKWSQFVQSRVGPPFNRVRLPVGVLSGNNSGKLPRYSPVSSTRRFAPALLLLPPASDRSYPPHRQI